MSRYPFKNLINDPEKKVSDSIVEQFFLTVRSADIDRIRDFFQQNKNKFNLIERPTNKTPFHAILELDEKVANNSTKLNIMNYLYEMGSPIDLPDRDNVWPIHLAANIQSDKIIDFLINKQVSISRKDSSGNTPLHYAVNGESVPCPNATSISISALNPPLKFDKMALNESLEKTNQEIITLLSKDPSINPNMLHLANTIGNIPEMYDQDIFSDTLANKVVEIFTDVAMDETFPSMNLTKQQTQLEQLIDETYNHINDDLLKGLTNPLSIGPNKGGWGPRIPNPRAIVVTDCFDDTICRDPNNIERIMEQTTDEIKREIEAEYALIKKKINSINTAATSVSVAKTLPAIDLKIIDYSNKVVRSNVTLAKILYLLIWQHSVNNYGTNLANRIIDHYALFPTPIDAAALGGPNAHHQIIDPRAANPILPGTHNFDSMLFTKQMINILEGIPNKNILDNILQSALETTSPLYLALNDSIANQIIAFFTKPISQPGVVRTETIDTNVRNGPLNNMTIENLLKEINFKDDDNIYKNVMIPTIINQSWFANLLRLIQEVQPQVAANMRLAGNIFMSGAAYVIPSSNLPGPQPVPGAAPVAAVYEQNYNFYDLFRILELIELFLTEGPIDRYNSPIDYLGSKISSWSDIVRTNFDHTNIDHNLLWLYFLYDIFVNYTIFRMRAVMSAAIQLDIDLFLEADEHAEQNVPVPDEINSINLIMQNNIADAGTKADISKAIIKMKQYFVTMDDSYLLNLILPSVPESRQFIDADTLPLINNFRAIKWTSTNTLYDEFNKRIIPAISKDLLDSIANLYLNTQYVEHNGHPPIPFISYAKLNKIRSIIESDAVRNAEELRIFFTRLQSVMKKIADDYMDDNTQRISIYGAFTDIIPVIKLADQFTHNINNLQDGNISDSFFLVETFGYLYAKTRQHINTLYVEFKKINSVVSDIISYANNRTFYFIPQIFLPALIAQVVTIIGDLFDLRNILTDFETKKSQFYPLVDAVNKTNAQFINDGNEFVAWIDKSLAGLYVDCMDLIKYHNAVIDFLNATSSYQLMRASRNKLNYDTNASNVFATNLIPLGSFSNLFEQVENFESVKKVLRNYKMPQNYYYFDKKELARTNYKIFAKEFADKTYRDIISYDRVGYELSNSPNIGDNLQINLVFDAATGKYAQTYPLDTIEGEILNINIGKTLQVGYQNGFIGFDGPTVNFDWTLGMLPSIKTFLGEHLRIIKQKIIQDVIQSIINNRAMDPANVAYDPKLSEMYDALNGLGNETTYDKIDKVKIYIIIGKVADSLLNGFIQYSIKKSIANWILSYAKEDQVLGDLINVIDNSISIIRKKNYSKIEIKSVKKDDVDKLIAIDLKYADYKLTQIEPNPGKMPYSSAIATASREFIHYLYNINYYSTGNITSNKKCFKINPKIISKLITADTINSKNADGNTPLHYAVIMNHPALVKELIQRGAKSNGFINGMGKTAYDLGKDNLLQHLEYCRGRTIIDSIDNFVVPFNDLLVARLRDEKFKNNIVKNITSGIPIQIAIYNHMFHLYSKNYKYDFYFELQDKVSALVQKYFQLNDGIYPYDIFTPANGTDVYKIIEVESLTNRKRSSINAANDKMIKSYQKQIEVLELQIENLNKERGVTIDAKQRLFIDQLMASLEEQKEKIQDKLDVTHDVAPPVIDNNLVTLYLASVNSIQNKTIDRHFDIIDFYNFSFARMGKTKELHVRIWNNYLDNEVSDSFSMIFSALNEILYLIIQNPDSPELLEELETIEEFFRLTKQYIESKADYPDSLDDNPILEQEFEQVAYLINLILTPAVKNILLNQIYQLLKESDATGMIFEDQTAVLDELLVIEFNGQTIESYLEKVLPTLAIKYYAGVYNDSSDTARKIISSQDLFTPIIEIIKMNKIIHVTEDSLMVQSMRDYIIPFISNTYQNFIHHLRLTVYGYERYLLNTYQLISVFNSLIN